MGKTITKHQQCVELAAEGWGLWRISKVLGIGPMQVVRNLWKADEEEKNGRVRKPLKPKPKRD